MLAMAPIRAQGGDERASMRTYGPLVEDHPIVGVNECPLCDRTFMGGDLTTIIPLGPGDDAERYMKARNKRWYACTGMITHARCAGLSEEVPDGLDTKGQT